MMNHENGGYDCPGCAWPDDRHGLTMDICEKRNAKASRGCRRLRNDPREEGQ